MYFKKKKKVNNCKKKVSIGADFITAFRTFLTFKLQFKVEKEIKIYINVKACSQAPMRFFFVVFVFCILYGVLFVFACFRISGFYFS